MITFLFIFLLVINLVIVAVWLLQVAGNETDDTLAQRYKAILDVLNTARKRIK